VTPIHSVKDFEHLKRGWDVLLENSLNTSGILSHEWFTIWWESFQDDNSLIVLAVYDDVNTLVAVAPLMRSSQLYYGIPVQKICFQVNGHSPYADFIVDKRCIKESIGAMMDYLLNDTSWDILQFQKLCESSATFSHLVQILEERCLSYGLKKNIETPYVEINSSWEAFLNQTSAKFRKSLRNKMNRVQRYGDISVEDVLMEDDQSPLLDSMFDISEKSWKKRAGSDIKSDPGGEKFYREICRRLGPMGIVKLWLLKKGGKYIAFEFQLKYNGIVYPLRADFDESYKKYSPGSVLEYEVLSKLFHDSSVKEYNTCGHTYSYLMNWTSKTRKYFNVEVFNSEITNYSLFCLRYKVSPFIKKFNVFKRLNKSKRR
jgi:CelD/BcsL family acetyltransferase involved in cellulose biosynthesis